MTRVKICGLKRVDDARVAVEEGAALLGLVFAPSRRRVEPEQAAAIVAAVRTHLEGAGRDPRSVAMVGVFVNERAEEMNRVAAYCDLDYLQLSGDEPDELIEDLRLPAIKAVHMADDLTPEALAARAERTPARVLLLDAAQQGAWGGTGQTFDWNRVPRLARPVLLAGGLHAGNVAEAIRRTRPFGVDVSSGVETDGEKDQGKIRAFLRAVRP